MSVDIEEFTPLIQVFDMPASVKFYRDILGFQIVAQSEPGKHFGWAMLKRGRMILMLNTAYEPEHRPLEADAARTAAHGDTAFFFNCPEPDAAHAYFQSKGLNATAPVVTHYGMKQVYVKDPDGYDLCFQCEAAPHAAAPDGGLNPSGERKPGS